MGFSKEWEKQYASNNHMSIWPWSDLVSYVMRYTDIRKRKLRVLEIGCGAGANIPLFAALQADYHAIDGSPTIVQELHKKFPQYKDNIIVGDFTEKIAFAGEFDLIVDRCSMTCNSSENIKKSLKLIRAKITGGGGVYIGIDWFSVNHDLYFSGEQGDDEYTITNLPPNSPLGGIGNIHFSDGAHIKSLFCGYKIEVMEEKIVHMVEPEKKKCATWNFIAKKI